MAARRSSEHAAGMAVGVVVAVVFGVAPSGAIAQPSAVSAPTRRPAGETSRDPARHGPDRFTPDPPWARGVSAADRARARELHARGTEHFLESRLPEAIALYRQALRYWDHPGIHFNLAVAQEYLGRQLAAHDSIERALRWADREPSPLSPAERDRAIALRDKIRARIVKLEIRCADAGAVVTVDGRALFTGPRTAVSWILPGAHHVEATKPGYASAGRSLVVEPGQTVRVELYLIPLDQVAGTRRWAAWKPWLVLGAGVASSVAGGALYWRSRVNDRAFRDAIAFTGSDPDNLPAHIAALDRRARLQWRAALVADAVAAAGVATGIALLYANRPRPHTPAVRIAPLGPDRAVGLTVTATF